MTRIPLNTGAPWIPEVSTIGVFASFPDFSDSLRSRNPEIPMFLGPDTPGQSTRLVAERLRSRTAYRAAGGASLASRYFRYG